MSPSPTPVRNAAWEWLAVILLGGNLVWTTLCLGGYRPETMVMTSGLNAMLVVLVLLAGAGGKRPADHPAGWLPLPFLAYAAVNAAWLTPVPWLGWHDWLEWSQIVGVFWCVLNGVRSPGPRRALGLTLYGLAVLAVGLAVYQRWVQPDWLMLGRIQAPQFIGRSSGPFGIPNSLAALLVLLLPAALQVGLNRRAGAWRIPAGITTFVLGLGLVLTVSRGAWLSLALALVSWPLLVSGRSWRRRLGISAVVLAGLVTVGTLLYFNSPVVRFRLDKFVAQSGEVTRPIMWRMAWQIFRRAPVTGGGAGSYNVLLEAYRPENFQDDPQWAHNDYLNTLSDYGMAGFGLLFGACGFLLWRCWRGGSGEGTLRVADESFPSPVGLSIGLLAFSLQLGVDFLFKIPALGMAFASIAALAVQRFWIVADGSTARRVRVGNGMTAALIAGIAIVWVLPHYRSEAARSDARRSIDDLATRPVDPPEESERLEAAQAAFIRAIAIDSGNAQAWADLSYVTTLQSRNDPAHLGASGLKAEEFARQALARSRVVPEFWLRLGVALDMQGRWTEAGDAFTEALRLAPNSSGAWYYEAYHLSLMPAYRKIAAAAVATCLRLDPSNREAEALRRKLAITP